MSRIRPTDYTTDNRDTCETWLHTAQGQTIEVRPADLVRNMIENLPEELAVKFLPKFNQLMDEIEKGI